MTSYYDASSKLTVGCLTKGTASVTYKNIDTNCELFSWGNADLHTDFTCIRCKSGYILKDVYDVTDSKHTQDVYYHQLSLLLTVRIWVLLLYHPLLLTVVIVA
jgi:hypothetical protein